MIGTELEIGRHVYGPATAQEGFLLYFGVITQIKGARIHYRTPDGEEKWLLKVGATCTTSKEKAQLDKLIADSRKEFETTLHKYYAQLKALVRS